MATTVYDLLRRRAGLSQEEAAALHQVRVDTVKSWCSDRRPAPKGALSELRDLYAEISRAGAELAGRLGAPSGGQVVIGVVDSVAAAESLGFPAVGAHEAAIGLAIAALEERVTVQLVPYKDGIATARAIADPPEFVGASSHVFESDPRPGPKRR